MWEPEQMVFVIFALQTTTIFHGRCKPGIAAAELIDLLCLITICRLFNRGLESPGTTKSQRLTTTKYLCRKKVCKIDLFNRTEKKKGYNLALKQQTVRSGGLVLCLVNSPSNLDRQACCCHWCFMYHGGAAGPQNICALYQLLVTQVFMSKPFSIVFPIVLLNKKCTASNRSNFTSCF